jgi:ketosteroid isomerase-like protein
MSGTTFKLSGFDRFPIRRGFALSRFVAFAILLAICGNILYAGQAKPKNRENRHEIEQLEETWRTAMVKSDTAAMSALLADDFIAITASGTLQTKEETLANLRSHRLHITSLAVSDRKLRFYGKTALVTSLAYVQGTTPDGDITGSYRYTRVYVLDPDEKWKIVSFEASRISQPNVGQAENKGTNPK